MVQSVSFKHYSSSRSEHPQVRLGGAKMEALGNIRPAIHLCLEARQEQGLPLLIESRVKFIELL